jgi:hypothetical protein
MPPQKDGPLDRIAALNLINNLQDKTFTSDGYIAELHSETLDEIAAEHTTQPEDSIFSTAISCSVFPNQNLPNQHLLVLQHQNESTATITLLTGTIFWIFSPPTDHNIKTLTTGYQTFANDPTFSQDNLNRVAESLTGGIIILQRTNEALVIPPFTISLALTLEPSVLAHSSITTTTNFLSLFSDLYIPLHKSWLGTEHNSAEKQRAFSEGLISTFADLLSTSYLSAEQKSEFKFPVTEPGPMVRVIENWDGIKAAVWDLLGDDAMRERLRVMWIELLLKATTQKCVICGQRCRRNRNSRKYRKTRPDAHFRTKHWF